MNLLLRFNTYKRNRRKIYILNYKFIVSKCTCWSEDIPIPGDVFRFYIDFFDREGI